MHVPQLHDACAAIAGGEDLDPGDIVAAAPEARRKKFKLPTAQRPQQQKGQGRWQEPPRRAQGAQSGLRMSMCYYHAKYGERARYCEEGCLWPEN